MFSHQKNYSQLGREGIKYWPFVFAVYLISTIMTCNNGSANGDHSISPLACYGPHLHVPLMLLVAMNPTSYLRSFCTTCATVSHCRFPLTQGYVHHVCTHPSPLPWRLWNSNLMLLILISDAPIATSVQESNSSQNSSVFSGETIPVPDMDADSDPGENLGESVSLFIIWMDSNYMFMLCVFVCM